MKITIERSGVMPDGREILSYTMTASSGMSATVLNLGGTLQKLMVPGPDGKIVDVICGFDDVQMYLVSGGYQGALVGRCANRIGGARFELDGETYDLYQNDNDNSLHGGKLGFSFRLWDVKASVKEGNGVLELSFFSPDGDEHYPGNLQVNVTYVLEEKGSLAIHYRAETDKATIVNLTNHSYFNLDGYADGGIEKHTLWMDTDRINNVDGGLIPDGTFTATAGTPYDFSEAKPIGRDFGADHPHMKQCEGYDTNFCVRDYTGDLRHIATLTGTSGRRMRVFTDQPCVQVYTANMVDPEDPAFKGDVKQYKHCAVALETQAMPDSINHEGFTNVVLRPGEVYDKTTILDFTK